MNYENQTWQSSWSSKKLYKMVKYILDQSSNKPKRQKVLGIGLGVQEETLNTETLGSQSLHPCCGASTKTALRIPGLDWKCLKPNPTALQGSYLSV